MMRPAFFAYLAATALAVVMPGLPGAVPGGVTLPGLPTPEPTSADSGSAPVAPPPQYGIVDYTSGSDAFTIVDTVITDGNGRTYEELPSNMVDGVGVFLAAAAAGETLTISCTSEDGCMFMVVLVRCTPCSVDFNGGLPGQLIAAGFEVGGCGPDYLFDGFNWNTNIFRKQVDYNEVLEFPLTKELKHAFVMYKTFSTTCAGKAEVLCPSTCLWDDAAKSCTFPRLCPVKPQGPWQVDSDDCDCKTL